MITAAQICFVCAGLAMAAGFLSQAPQHPTCTRGSVEALFTDCGREIFHPR